MDEQGQAVGPPQPPQHPPPIVQETWAKWCGSLVRKTYGEAAITVTKGHSSQHHMVKSMTLFIKDLAKEVERVGGLRKKGIVKHNADATNPRVPQPVVEQDVFDALPEIGPSINYDRIIRSHSNRYTKSTYGWAPYDGLMTRIGCEQSSPPGTSPGKLTNCAQECAV